MGYQPQSIKKPWCKSISTHSTPKRSPYANSLSLNTRLQDYADLVISVRQLRTNGIQTQDFLIEGTWGGNGELRDEFIELEEEYAKLVSLPLDELLEKPNISVSTNF